MRDFIPQCSRLVLGWLPWLAPGTQHFLQGQPPLLGLLQPVQVSLPSAPPRLAPGFLPLLVLEMQPFLVQAKQLFLVQGKQPWLAPQVPLQRPAPPLLAPRALLQSHLAQLAWFLQPLAPLASGSR